MLSASTPPSEPQRAAGSANPTTVLAVVAAAGLVAIVAAATLWVLVAGSTPDTVAVHASGNGRQLLPVESTPPLSPSTTPLAANPLNRGGRGAATTTTLPIYYANQSGGVVVPDGLACPGYTDLAVTLVPFNAGSSSANHGAGRTRQVVPQLQNLGVLFDDRPLARYQIIAEADVGGTQAVVWLVDCATVVGERNLVETPEVIYRTQLVAYAVNDSELQRIGEPTLTPALRGGRYGSDTYHCAADRSTEGDDIDTSVDCTRPDNTPAFTVALHLTRDTFEADIA